MDKSKIKEIAECIRRYCRGQLNNAESERLIKLAAKIARQKLWGRIRAAALAQGTTIDQMAISLVAGLFAGRDSDSILAKSLKKFLESDDATLFLRFQAVARQFTEQELFQRWPESDSKSAKIWRNLNRVLRHDTQIEIFPNNKPVWACLTGQKNLNDDLLPVNLDKIAEIIGRSAGYNNNFTDMIYNIISEIAGLDGYQNVVKIEFLFSGLRQATAQIFNEELKSNYSNNSNEPLIGLIVEKSTETANRELETKLNKYINAHKLNSDETAYFKRALTDLLEDCKDGGPARSYYQYLSGFWPDLKLEDYRQKYRTRFEYLAEFVQNRFYELLKRELK